MLKTDDKFLLLRNTGTWLKKLLIGLNVRLLRVDCTEKYTTVLFQTKAAQTKAGFLMRSHFWKKDFGLFEFRVENFGVI